MTTTTKIAYSGAVATNVTLTGTSLASNTVGTVAFTGRQSAAVDNSSNLYLDVMVRVKTKGQAGSTGSLLVYCASAIEATTPSYTDGCTGSDAAFTAPTNGTNMRLLGAIQLNGTTAVVSHAMSVAAAFGGVVPQKFAIVWGNFSGGALSATAGDHSLDYVGITATNA